MSYKPKRSVNGCMVPGNGARKTTSSSGRTRVARQHSVAADDPRNYTAPHPEQMHWSIHSLPDILYQLRPVDTGVPEQRIDMKDGTLYGNRLRDLPALPDHISSNVEEWRVEAWMRLDKRVRLGDITERMHPEFRIPNNTLQQRSGRFRQDFHLISWYSGNRKSAEIEAKVIQKLQEKNIDPALNSTRGLTPGLINPELGEAGGKIPLPANWSGLKIARAPRRRAAAPSRNTHGIRNTAPQNLTPPGNRRRDGRHDVGQQGANTAPRILTPISNLSPVGRHTVSQQAENSSPWTAAPAVRQQRVTNATIPLIGNTDGFINEQQAMALRANGIMPTQNVFSRLEQARQEGNQQPERRVSHHPCPEGKGAVQLRFPQSSAADTKTPKHERIPTIDTDTEDIQYARMSLDILENLVNLSHIPLPGNLDPVDEDYMAKEAAIRQFASDRSVFPHRHHGRGFSTARFGGAAYMAKQATVDQFVEELQGHKALAPREDEAVYSVEGGVSLRDIENDVSLDALPFDDTFHYPFDELSFPLASPLPTGMFSGVSESYDMDIPSISSQSTGLSFASAESSDSEMDVDFSEWLHF